VSATTARYRVMSLGVYLGVCLFALCVATARLRAQGQDQPAPNPAATEPVAQKPYFQLSTNHTYGTTDRPRVWINYQAVDHLDFRVYRVAHPVEFFAKLNDPHKMGEREKTEVTQTYEQKPSTLEKVRGFKTSFFKSITNYFRSQLQPASRETLTQKFGGDSTRTPLNVADYARVPLLNQDQLVESWRQALKPLENDYDTRMVLIGK
jgi:hypothetical protein